MNNFQHIQVKLQQFVKKFYINEFIKGLILFCAFGLLYFILTLFIEYFLWLNPMARTVLFWVFILVELILFTKFIVVTLFKLVGLRKGISLEEASRLIGKHFSEVDDKLLNVLQLNRNSDSSELLLASIEQKSKTLEPIPFKNAIQFNSNLKYIKYALLPILVWFVVFVTGNKELFSSSYDRVVHHRTVYIPPAPFKFTLENSKLEVHKNKSITITVLVNGSVVPQDVQVGYLDQKYYIKNLGEGRFEYTFPNVKESFSFYFDSNGVRSHNYFLEMIPTPVITSFEMYLDYPAYTHKKDEFVKNTGNAIVPRGTRIHWKLKGQNTETITIRTDSVVNFNTSNKVDFDFSERVFRSFDYEITSSNSYITEYESVKYKIEVLKDAFPKIEVRSNIDSIARGRANFYGQLSDDYGINKLNLVYYDRQNPSEQFIYTIEVNTSSFEDFYYVFPDGITLNEGIDYEMYFEVFDNDAILGSKSSKSNTFHYYNKTEGELKDKLLEEQQETLEDLENTLEKNEENRKEIQEFQESLQKNSEMNWNDQKQLDNFIERQEQYQEMMEKQRDALEENLQEQPLSTNPALNEKKKDIEERIKEAEDLAKKNELLEELKKLAEKLDKEELTKKLKELSEQNRQNDRSLERLLELTKRFYVEQKANQIKEKIEELAKEQEDLSKENESTSEEQKDLNKKFDTIEKELQKLDKDNKELKKPLDLPKTQKDQESIKEEMEGAKEDLKNSEENENAKEKNSAAKKKQKSAAQKMKKMAQKLEGAMQSMAGESMDEDIEMLRAILENLVEFSFQQEFLMDDFSSISNEHPSFSDNLKRQQVLREYFEHIDDSLYTLSMRQPKIGNEIFKDLSKVHYHMDEALIHFADNQLNVGLSDQQFVMTSTNSIAALLSEILNGMQNASASMGSGSRSGSGQDSFSLPDIIQKQEDAQGKMEEGMKKKGDKGKEGDDGAKDGDKDGNGKEKNGSKGDDGNSSKDGEQMNGELFKIYKEQAELRRLLEEGLKDKMGEEGLKLGKNALRQMEQLEQLMLEKGFNNEVLQRMKNLKHELLKLKEAVYQKGMELERKSNQNTRDYKRRVEEDLNDEKLWFNENEILNRQSLPLRSNYKERVQYYFKVNDSIQ